MSDLTQAEIVSAVLRSLEASYPPKDFDADWKQSGELDDAARLLLACLEILDEEASHPKATKAALTGFKAGYGCWLDWVRTAIEKAEGLDDAARWALYGSFQMATAFLFDIEGHNKPGSWEKDQG